MVLKIVDEVSSDGHINPQVQHQNVRPMGSFYLRTPSIRWTVSQKMRSLHSLVDQVSWFFHENLIRIHEHQKKKP